MKYCIFNNSFDKLYNIKVEENNTVKVYYYSNNSLYNSNEILFSEYKPIDVLCIDITGDKTSYNILLKLKNKYIFISNNGIYSFKKIDNLLYLYKEYENIFAYSDNCIYNITNFTKIDNDLNKTKIDHKLLKY